MRLNIFAFVALIFLLQVNAQAARQGSEGGNGGDPVAQSFASTLGKITLYLEQNPRFIMAASRLEARAYTETIQNSLGNKNSESIIEVVEQRPRDEFGVAKAAVTTLNPLKIRIHRDSWVQSKNPQRSEVQRDQVVLAGMELFLIIGLEQNRYEIAFNELGKKSQEILAATVDSGPQARPRNPAETNPLEEIVSVKEYRVVDDYFLQALQNSKFKDCKIVSYTGTKPDDFERWVVKIYHGNRDYYTLGTFKVDGEMKELSRSKDGKTIRGRIKAEELDGRPVSNDWSHDNGLIIYTATLNEDGTEIKELRVQDYLLKSVNAGVGFNRESQLQWVRFNNFSCKNIK